MVLFVVAIDRMITEVQESESFLQQ